MHATTHMSDDLDLTSCIRGFDETRRELERIEDMLAEQYGIDSRSRIRRTLLELELAGKLACDELVAEWQATYSRYLDWTEDDRSRASSDADWEADNPEAAPTGDTRHEEAASAASSLLCVQL
jgi:hypothetical protein